MSLRRLKAGLVAMTVAVSACGGAADDPGAGTFDAGAIAPLAEVVPALDFLGDLGEINSLPVTFPVGPDGGSATLENGSTIEVPSGAFRESVDLSVVVVDVLFDKYLEGAPRATIYVLSTPQAARLAAPVVLNVPIPATEVVVEALVDREWVMVDVPPGPTARIEFDHFSQQVRSVIPTGHSPMSEAEWQQVLYQGLETSREQERIDNEQADEFARQGWCFDLMTRIASSQEFEEAGKGTIAMFYGWIVCLKWPVADESCFETPVDGTAKTLDELDRCFEPPAGGVLPEESAGGGAEDELLGDAPADDQTDEGTLEGDETPPATVGGATDPADVDLEPVATLTDVDRVFSGTGSISYSVGDLTTEFSTVTGCSVDLEVEVEFVLRLDGEVTLRFGDWPLSSGHADGSKQWVECFAPADKESWGAGQTGPNVRIYSTQWIGVGDSVSWPPIEIPSLGAIAVGVRDTVPIATALGDASFSVDHEVLTLEGISVVEDHETYSISFTLVEVP